MKKNFIKIVSLLSLILLTSCTSLFGSSRVKEQDYTPEEAKNWDVTLANSLMKNALIPEWYGNEKPIIYLRKTGKMDEKEFKFLETLRTKTIEKEDLDKFSSLVYKYNSKIEREFFLENENIKDGKALVAKMVEESELRVNNPSKHIKDHVADKKQWNKIVAMSKKPDLNEDDIKSLRKILNDFIDNEKFFDQVAWLNTEISERTADLVRVNAIKDKDDLEFNNLNAKALYVAYSEYLSNMDRWDD